MDTIVRNARVRDRDYSICDIGVQGEKVVAIEARIEENTDTEIDAAGGIVVPSFIDTHSHLDKAMMIYDSPPAITGTLSESLERSYVAKSRSSVDDVVKRGADAIKWALANGTGAIRVHSDVDSSWGITGVEGLIRLREMFKNVVDLEVLVLPAENPMTEDLRRLIRSGMEAGADAIGGSPHLEYTANDVIDYVDFIFEIAEEFQVPIDLHLDQNVDPTSYTRAIEYVLTKAYRENVDLPITLNHCGALGAYAPAYLGRVIGLMKKVNASLVACPKEELIIAGMSSAPIKTLIEAGINCGYAHNNIGDSFSPYGRMDMLEAGLIGIHAFGFNRKDQAELMLDMGTNNPARVMRLDDYGVEIGRTANFNVIDAPDAYEAYRQNADRRFVIRRGKVVSRTTTSTVLDLPESTQV